MKHDDVSRLIKEMTGEDVLTYPGQGNVACSCPLAEWTHENGENKRRSFSIKVNDFGPSAVYCWHSDCGYSGNSFTLARDYFNYSGIDLQEFIADLESIDFDPNFNVFDHVGGSVVAKVIGEEYLDQFTRLTPEQCGGAYSEEEIDSWELMWDSDQRTIIFPARNIDGGLLGCQGRRLNPTDPKKKHHNYGILNTKTGKTSSFRKGTTLYGINLDFCSGCVIVVEGPRDAIKTRSATGAHVVALYGSQPTGTQIKLLKEYEKIYIFPDNDKAGRVMVKKLLAALNEDCEVYIVSYKGMNTPDPGGATLEEIKNLVDDAKKVRIID